MVQIPIIRESNIKWGIAISTLVTVGSYIIISIISGIGGFIFGGFYLFADIQFVLGTIAGVIVTLSKREEDQAIVKTGVITGALGGISSSIFISFYQMIIVAIVLVPNITVFFLYLGLSLISGIVIGLIGGALISTYFTYKEMKGEPREEDIIKDDFYDKLKE